MSHQPLPASLSPSTPQRSADRRVALLAVGALLSLLCVSSLFWMHVDLVAMLREWSRADASLSLIAFGTMVAGQLITAWLGE